MTGGGTAGRWRRVEEVVGAALERDPAHRAAFLDAACAGDPELRREAESLLAAHDGPGALDALAADVAPLAARLRGPDPTATAPRTMGRYRVGARIAGGGMGVVYEAIDEPLGRRVALKFLAARLHADDSAAERFRREARTVAALEHPNICTVHEIGEDADGGLFIAMPLYDGETLQRRIARGPLAIGEAVAIAVQVARGLAKAHAAGVVHRDVKPSNVFLTADGVVKLLDFGIAKLTDATMTVTGSGPIGTVAYMSPEQARGAAVDHRSDLWSLGVLLYEMLAGRRPFQSDSPRVVLEAIEHSRHVPLADHRPDVPPALAAVVDRALAKSPDERYRSAAQLERDLLALGLAQNIPGGFGAQAVSSGGESGPAPRRRGARRWLAGAGVALALVAAVGVLWLSRARRAAAMAATPPEPSVVVLPFASLGAGDDDGFGDGLTDEIITSLAAVPHLKVISRTSAMHYKGSAASLKEIAGELGVANVLEGSVRRSGDRLRVTAQLVDARTDGHRWARAFDVQRRDVFDVQTEIARQVVSALRLTLQEEERRGLARRGTNDPEALDLYRRGRFHWERRNPIDHAKAVADFERAIARDSGYADAWAGLADAYLLGYQGWFSPLSEAELFARHKAAAERALALDDGSAAAHTSMATSYLWRRDWPAAEREFRRAIALEPGNVTARYWYGLLLGGEGRLDEAVQEARISSELDPFAVISVLNYGWTCHLAHDFVCGIEQYRRGIELTTAWERAHSQLGLFYAYTGRFDEGRREVETAIAANPRIGAYQADLALVHASAGHRVEARQALARALALPRAFPLHVARAYAALREPDSAFAWLDRVDWRWPFNSRWDPGLDPLRADPRFARLSARVDREMGMR